MPLKPEVNPTPRVMPVTPAALAGTDTAAAADGESKTDAADVEGRFVWNRQCRVALVTAVDAHNDAVAALVAK